MRGRIAGFIEKRSNPEIFKNMCYQYYNSKIYMQENGMKRIMGMCLTVFLLTGCVFDQVATVEIINESDYTITDFVLTWDSAEGTMSRLVESIGQGETESIECLVAKGSFGFGGGFMLEGMYSIIN